MYINYIKYIFQGCLMLVLMMLPFTPEAQNQTNGNGTSISISASATVIGADIELETISDMGIIDAQRTQEGTDIYINPVFDSQAGIMRARGNPDAQVRVSFLKEMEVSRREGPGVILFTYEISGYPGDNQRESQLLTLIEHELNFSENGEFYFYIGGRVDLSEALPGNYDGEFTLEIEYM